MRSERLEQWREVTGELRALRRTILASREEGWVIEIGPDAGDAVATGDVIARLEAESAELDLLEAKATVATRAATVREREAALAKAKRDQVKMLEMEVGGAAKQVELDDAQTNVDAASARLDQAKAELAAAEAQAGMARKRLSDHTITAPFAGSIVAKRTEIGQWLDRGDPVVEILALDVLEARLDVPESFLADLAAPSPAPSASNGSPPTAPGPATSMIRVRVPSMGITRDAPITAIVPDGDRRSRLFPVRATLPNADQLLRPGMTVVGLVPSRVQEETLTIHKDAVLRNDAGEYVYFDAGGTATAVKIRTLFAVGERVAIAPGPLRAGMKVITDGNERLFPGQPIRQAGAPPSPAPPPAAGGAPGGPATTAGDEAKPPADADTPDAPPGGHDAAAHQAGSAGKGG